MVSVCLKALEGSNYDVRVQVAQLLGVLMAGSQTALPSGSKAKKISIEEMFSIMAAAFLKGKIRSQLKYSWIIRTKLLLALISLAKTNKNAGNLCEYYTENYKLILLQPNQCVLA